MRLLIIGGTAFLGRHLVAAALERGHEVTLFNRGRRNTELFPEVEKLRGDRNGDLGQLRGRRWDAVVDTCGYLPQAVRASAGMLSRAVEHYTYISSISVYPERARPGIDESSPVSALTDEEIAEAARIEPVNPIIAANYGQMYGGLKALCERAAEEAMPGRVLNVRPGLVVGPHDYSDRFSYWVARVAQGGEVLAPGRPERLVQMIDVRDLAEWTLRMAERRQTGVYNATGPEYPLSMRHLLAECRRVSESDAVFTWPDEDFLLARGAQPWGEVPLWIPGVDDTVGFERALAAGLTFRPLAETIRDTLRWERTRTAGTERLAGLEPAKERQLLRAWHDLQRGDSGTEALN
ncbi:MAG TPA: NAD-dependent epimerase/dehydratase family protein [Pyrinomonadaceae bacterium]|jgi:2'-hydroxyisoflavone reductase